MGDGSRRKRENEGANHGHQSILLDVDEQPHGHHRHDGDGNQTKPDPIQPPGGVAFGRAVYHGGASRNASSHGSEMLKTLLRLAVRPKVPRSRGSPSTRRDPTRAHSCGRTACSAIWEHCAAATPTRWT